MHSSKDLGSLLFPWSPLAALLVPDAASRNLCVENISIGWRRRVEFEPCCKRSLLGRGGRSNLTLCTLCKQDGLHLR